MRQSPQTTRFAILNPERSSFPEWNFVQEREYHLEWKPEYNEYLPEYDMVDGMYEELVVGVIAEK